MTTAQKISQEAVYRERTPGSCEAFRRAGEVMPGVAKGAYYYAPPQEVLAGLGPAV